MKQEHIVGCLTSDCTVQVQEWPTSSKIIKQEDPLFLQSCLDDALNALYNELRFSFKGLPSSTNLSPALAPQTQMTSTHPVSNSLLLPANYSNSQ